MLHINDFALKSLRYFVTEKTVTKYRNDLVTIISLKLAFEVLFTVRMG